MAETDWRTQGVRIVKAGELDFNTAQTPGMTRAAAIDHAKAGAQKLWAGTVSVAPNAKTGAHHHGHLESIIYVVRGRARMRWGERLEFMAEADPGGLHLRAAVCAASGDQCLAGRPSGMRGGAERPGGGGGEPRHRAGRGGRGGALGRPEPSGGVGLTRLEIVSDVVCPWCYLGAANLMRAVTAREGHPFAIALAAVPARPDHPGGGDGPGGLHGARSSATRRGSRGRTGGWSRWGGRPGSPLISSVSGGRPTRSTRTG